ncbi:MAG: hypothetical protein AAFR93_14295, partial [Pseudomonadota bacterium]
GNASLAFGRGFGVLNETGAHYRQTINAYQFHLAADKEGDAQLGLVYEAPIAQGAVSYGMRLGTGKLENGSSGLGEGDTAELAVFGGYKFAAISLGAEVGLQDITLSGASSSDQQQFASLGFDYKVGRTSLSVELGVSEFAGVDYQAAAIGLRYDIARGFSGNVGANYSDDGSKDTWTIPISLRYEF